MSARDSIGARLAVAARESNKDVVRMVMRVAVSLLVIAVALGMLPATATGAEFGGESGDYTNTSIKAGNITIRQDECYTVPEGETMVADLYTWARCIVVDGTLDGDVIAGFQEGTVSGLITQDLNAACETMTITGRVADDVRIACETLIIEGEIGGDLIAAAKDIRIGEGADVAGDILVACGTLTLDGHVGGRARVITGFVNLDGTIDGNAEITTDGGIRYSDAARIGGELVYEGPSRIDFPDEMVAGAVTYHHIEPDEFDTDFDIPEGLGFFLHLLGFIAALIAGTIIVALTPDHARRTADIIHRKPLKSLGIGFVTYICMPIALLILLVLILTIPLMVVALLAYLITLYIAKFYFSIWLGNLILRRTGRTDVSPIPSMLLGLVIVYLVTAIPILGTLIGIVIIFFGLGALLQRKETRLDAAFEPQPVSKVDGLPNDFPGKVTGA